MSNKTVHATLQKDLKLSKKYAKWVPKLLYEEMKKEPIRMCKVFVVIIAAVP
jgi:hypothetical protein